MNRQQLSRVFCLSVLAALQPVLADGADDAGDRIAEALLALPGPLQEGAGVVRFEDGKQIELKAAENGILCRADDPERPGIDVWCYHESHDDYARRWFELAASGMSGDEVNEQIVAEIEDRTLAWPDLAVNYNLRGPSLDTAMLLTVIYMPYATGASIGITEERQFDRPWLMYPGTAFAHVMIPGQ